MKILRNLLVINQSPHPDFVAECLEILKLTDKEGIVITCTIHYVIIFKSRKFCH
jgi:hypothetical protein